MAKAKKKAAKKASNTARLKGAGGKKATSVGAKKTRPKKTATTKAAGRTTAKAASRKASAKKMAIRKPAKRPRSAAAEPMTAVAPGALPTPTVGQAMEGVDASEPRMTGKGKG